MLFHLTGAASRPQTTMTSAVSGHIKDIHSFKDAAPCPFYIIKHFIQTNEHPDRSTVDVAWWQQSYLLVATGDPINPALRFRNFDLVRRVQRRENLLIPLVHVFVKMYLPIVATRGRPIQQ